jgi:GH25 family lysozyme M1 (1,4-beta-N-acetylmuramidase)
MDFWPVPCREKNRVSMEIMMENTLMISVYCREAKTQLHKVVSTFLSDLQRKMGVRAVILTAHNDENDQAHVSKYDLSSVFRSLN